jgi:hypothetical protein
MQELCGKGRAQGQCSQYQAKMNDGLVTIAHKWKKKRTHLLRERRYGALLLVN